MYTTSYTFEFRQQNNFVLDQLEIAQNMCGIFCLLQKSHRDVASHQTQIDDPSKELLRNRGPNAQREQSVTVGCFNIHLSGFVLWQQGAKLCEQPFSSKHHILLMNGDIFSKRDNQLLSDTEWLTRLIDDCNEDEAKLFEMFRSLKGPYSITYLNQSTQKLYFLRDVFGRQSLLLARTHQGDTILSSVLAASKHQYASCIELPPLGIFCMNLASEEITLNPWQPMNAIHMEQLEELKGVLQTEIDIKSTIASPWLIKQQHEESLQSYNFENILKDSIKNPANEIFQQLLGNANVVSVADEIERRLENSISERILATPSVCRQCLQLNETHCNHARIGILFSGGIDCTILAVLADKLLDSEQPIDLINVSFEKVSRSSSACNGPIDYNTPDRLSARDSLQELRRLNPNRKWNLVEVNVTRQQLNEALRSRISHLVYPLNSVLDESIGCVLWFGGQGCGTVDGLPYSTNCRVLLIGSGADELFGGYTRHRNAFLRQYEGVNLSPFERLENELEFDFNRLPSRNLARDDRVIGDHGVTARSPYLEEDLVHFVRAMQPYQKCYHALEQGVGDKLLLRLCGFRLGVRDAARLKKRAMQFGSRVADRKQNAKDTSQMLTQIFD